VDTKKNPKKTSAPGRQVWRSDSRESEGKLDKEYSTIEGMIRQTMELPLESKQKKSPPLRRGTGA